MPAVRTARGAATGAWTDIVVHEYTGGCILMQRDGVLDAGRASSDVVRVADVDRLEQLPRGRVALVA